VVNADVEITLTLAAEVVLKGTVRVEGPAQIALDQIRVRLQAPLHSLDAVAVMKPDGSFSIPRIEPIHYRVRVTTPAGSYVKSIRIGDKTLGTPEIDGANLSGAAIITIATDGAQIDGLANADTAAVVLVPDGPLRDWTDLTRSAVADRDGKFLLRDIAPGRYLLFAWEDADPEATLDPDFRRPFLDQAVAVQVAAGERQTLEVKALSLLRGN
jgi:hypothetical protein